MFSFIPLGSIFSEFHISVEWASAVSQAFWPVFLGIVLLLAIIRFMMSRDKKRIRIFANLFNGRR